MIEFVLNNWWAAVIVGGAGTVAVGLVTNALWEVLRPPYLAFVKTVFAVVTFKNDALKNKIVSDASIGFIEKPSLFLAMSLVLTWIGISGGLATRAFTTLQFRHLSEALKEQQANGEDVNMQQLMEGDPIASFLISSFPTLVVVFLAIMVPFIFVQLRFFVSMNRTNLIIGWFNQNMSILGPVLSGDDQALYRQQFALMNTEDDLATLIASLKNKAAENSIEFKPPYWN